MIAFWFSFLSLFQVILILGVLLWGYCLVDILKNEFNNNDKLIWLLLVILVLF